MKRKVLLCVMSAMVASTAFADRVIAVRDWALDDYSTAQNPTGSCVISFNKRVNRTDYRLEIIRQKGVAGAATEIFLRATGPGEGTAGWHIPVANAGGNISFAQHSTDATSRFFWSIPRNTQAIINTLSSGTKLRIYSHGGSREVKYDISERGFRDVLTAMQQRCNGGQAIDNRAFEQAFLAQSQRDVDPVVVDAQRAEQLRGMFHSAAQVWGQKEGNDRAIAALRAQYGSVINELDSLTALVDQISNRELPALRQQQSANEALKTSSERELASLTPTIPRLQTEMNNAATTLDRAEAALAPHVPEHDRLVSIVSSAQRQLSNSRSTRNSIASSISSLEDDLDDLDDELRALQSEESRLQRDQGPAEQVRRDAEREMRAFNEEFRRREILRNNSRYSQAQQELPRAQAEAVQARREADQASGRVQQAQNDLQQRNAALTACRAVEGADCSAQDAEVQRAQREVQIARDAARDVLARADQADRRVTDLRSTITSAERDADNQVNREKQVLIDRLNRAESELARINNRLVAIDRRQRDITSNEIPNTRSRLDNLRFQLSQVESQIIRDEAAVDAAARDLSAFESRVGWVAKQRAVQAAADNLDAKTSAYNNAVARKATLERQIQICLSERTRIADQIAARTQVLNQSQARLAVLRNDLAPYIAEKARLDAIGGGLDRQLAAASAQFNSTLPR